MIKKFISLIIIIFSNKSFAQTLTTVEKLENKYQECLDSGIGMKKCASDFYLTCDSLLNVSFKNLKIKLNKTDQNNLKIEQINWLKKRDTYFKKASIEAKNEMGEQFSNDYKMVLFDKKSEFVMLRVKELIKRRNKIK